MTEAVEGDEVAAIELASIDVERKELLTHDSSRAAKGRCA